MNARLQQVFNTALGGLGDLEIALQAAYDKDNLMPYHEAYMAVYNLYERLCDIERQLKEKKGEQVNG